MRRSWHSRLALAALAALAAAAFAAAAAAARPLARLPLEARAVVVRPVEEAAAVIALA